MDNRRLGMLLGAALVCVLGSACGDDDGGPALCGPSTCNEAVGGGTCDDSTGEAVCSCSEGYVGAWCDQCDDGYALEDGACLPTT